MYYTNNVIKYKVINTITGEKSKWCETESELLNQLEYMFRRQNHFSASFATVLSAVKQNKNDNNNWNFSIDDILHIYCNRNLRETNKRFLIITDNYNRFITPDILNSLEYDYHNRYYNIKNFPMKNYNRFITPDKLNSLEYDYHNRYYNIKNFPMKNYNRKKKLREKDSGYRKEPVSRTGKRRYHGRYGRRIHYKETWLLFEDDQCKEYGIKGYRPRRRLDAWDIESVEHCSRSWKDKKIRRQWMKNKR